MYTILHSILCINNFSNSLIHSFIICSNSNNHIVFNDSEKLFELNSQKDIFFSFDITSYKSINTNIILEFKRVGAYIYYRTNDLLTIYNGRKKERRAFLAI